jgi:hypothetical protein
MKSIFKILLIKISRVIYLIYRVIYYLIPIELRSKLEFKLQSKLKSKLQLKLEDNLVNETTIHFNKHFKKSLLFDDKWKIREHAIKTSLLNDKNKEYYYLEFGVFEGTTANYFSKLVKKLYCFDSFEGLKEDWAGTSDPKSAFNLNKKVPKLNSNVEPIVGWVEDTLEFFLKKHNPKINFVHLDMDIYSATRFTLERLKPYLVKNAVILFDELYNYDGWESGEYKALKEIFNENEFEYKSFNLLGCQSMIKLK